MNAIKKLITAVLIISMITAASSITSFADFIPLEIGTPVSATLNADKKVVQYTYTATEEGTYTFYLEECNNSNALMISTHHSQAEIAFDENGNPFITTDLKAGGLFQIDFHLTSDVEVNFTLNSKKFVDNISYIEIDKAPEAIYYFNDTACGVSYSGGTYKFTPSKLEGIQVSVYYKDGTSKTFNDADLSTGYLDGNPFEISAITADKPGTYTATFEYMSHSATFEVALAESIVESLKVIKNPDVTEHDFAFAPTYAGMQVEILYKDGSKKVVEITEELSIKFLIPPNVIAISNDLETDLILHYDYADDNTPVCWIYYMDKKCEAAGFTCNKTPVAVDIKNPSIPPLDTEMEITYSDESTENITLNANIPESGISTETTFRGIMRTEKGYMFLYMEKLAEDSSITYRGNALNCAFSITKNLIKGDVNFDGVVDANDALAVLKHAAKLNILNEDAIMVAEVTGDDVISADDALQILKFAAHLIDEL